mgnify:CR=1 FL=1
MVRQGTKSDANDIQEIFYESVNWMQNNHIKQWHYEDLNALYSMFELKDFYLCFSSENKAVGFMILSTKDIKNCWTKFSLKNSMYPLMYLFGKNSMPDVDNLLTSFYQLDDEARQEIVHTIQFKLQYHKDPQRAEQVKQIKGW